MFNNSGKAGSILFEERTESPEQTRMLGSRLANAILSNPCLPAFIALDGDLGAGKTEFVRGFVSVASPGSAVRSPTFTLVNEYTRGRRGIYHFDAYRIKDDDDLYSTGFYDYPEDGIFLVEWASLIPYALPSRLIRVTIEKDGVDARIRTVKCAVCDTSN